ncbi:MAG TPA: sensor histidine kinase [Candidatus Acetothermia bacterium]|nr:sensor histidine kinase [Candidatus Acetothermia bacterium]
MKEQGAFPELKRTILKTIFARRITLGAFAAVALIVMPIAGISWFTPLFYAPLAWFLITFPFQYLVKRQNRETALHWIHASYFIAEAVVITLFVYLTGGSQWIGNAFYIFTVMYANFFLPEAQGYLVTGLVVVLYTLVVILEYMGVLPHRTLFPGMGTYHANLSYNLATILVGTATIYGVLTYTVRSFTNIYQSKNKALAKQREKLSKLSLRLVSIQNEERQHIAHELHDNLGQLLAAVKLRLAAMKGDMDVDRSREIVTIVNQAIGQTRTLAYSLRPPLLDDLGLAPSVRRLAQMVEEGTSLRVITDLEDDFRLSSDTESLLFYVIREGLANVEHHARAHQAKVSLRRTEDAVVVSVEDDGIGMSTREVFGLGLRGIEERVELVGGSMRIISSPGQGTTITVEVPYETGAPGDR